MTKNKNLPYSCREYDWSGMNIWKYFFSYRCNVIGSNMLHRKRMEVISCSRNSGESFCQTELVIWPDAQTNTTATAITTIITTDTILLLLLFLLLSTTITTDINTMLSIQLLLISLSLLLAHDFKTRCQIWCTIEFHRDPISKVLSEW